MDKNAFMDYCQKELLAVYCAKKAGNEDKIRMSRLEGVIHAGQMLEVLDKQAAGTIIDNAHVQVFGYTREVRDNKKAKLNALKDGDSDHYYETPAYLRLR
ncbi:hypothetical protein HHX48_00900 [Salinimonas sp. HHU 13199]|uniref:Uncharacterized protein n=1 Tax=Salinimonas profundi TaxID=2729140 RepID=A0ABR8LK31_9ALTE|nr:hypothetical protein [Salinimonas profundi]MBD3584289.1 hypothetical protein [Salinimonas profundi]